MAKFSIFLLPKSISIETYNTRNTLQKWCFYPPLPDLVSSLWQVSCGTARLASGRLPKNALPLATERIFSKVQWSGIKCQQTKNRYVTCLLARYYLQSTWNVLWDQDASLFCVSRTMPLLTFSWTTPSSWLHIKEKGYWSDRSTSQRSCLILT